jgi:soluble cytochrome b562
MNKILVLILFCLFATTGLSSATPLEQSMKRMSTAYKKLTIDLKQPVDASKPDYLALATAMKTEAQTSRGLVPKKVAAMPQDQQAAQIADYQKSLDSLSATIDTLSADVTASNWTDANAQIAKLKQQMFDGHKKFRKKEDHGAPAPAAAASPATTNAPAPLAPTQASTVTPSPQ